MQGEEALYALAPGGEASAEAEAIYSALQHLMSATLIGRYEVQVVEVGQCRFGMPQTAMSGETLLLVGRLLGPKRYRTRAM